MGMKRLSAVILFCVVLLSATAPAFAITTKTWTIDELDMSIDIPLDWYVITRTEAMHPVAIADKLGISISQFQKDMPGSAMFLDAIMPVEYGKDIYELYINAEENEGSRAIWSLTSENIEESMKNFELAIEKNSATMRVIYPEVSIGAAETCEYNATPYLSLTMNGTANGSKLYSKQYATIVNGRTIFIYCRKTGTSGFDGHSEYLFEQALKSISFDAKPNPQPEALAQSRASNGVDAGSSTLAASAFFMDLFLTVIVYLFVPFLIGSSVYSRTRKKPFKAIVIVNGIVFSIAFYILREMMGIKQPYTIGGAAFLWSWVAIVALNRYARYADDPKIERKVALDKKRPPATPNEQALKMSDSSGQGEHDNTSAPQPLYTNRVPGKQYAMTVKKTDMLKHIEYVLMDFSRNARLPGYSLSMGAVEIFEEIQKRFKKGARELALEVSMDHTAHLVIHDAAYDMLTCGKYHLWRGVLNPMGPGPDIYRIFDECTDWALNNKHITEKEKADIHKALRASMAEIG
jgi:hypothetical protein